MGKGFKHIPKIASDASAIGLSGSIIATIVIQVDGFSNLTVIWPFKLVEHGVFNPILELLIHYLL